MSRDRYYSESRGEMTEEEKENLRKRALKEVSGAYKLTEADKKANAEARAPAVVYDDDAAHDDLHASRFTTQTPREGKRK